MSWFPLVVLLSGCGSKQLETSPCRATLGAGAWSCEVPGWADRGYYAVLPKEYDGSPIPVVIDFHGGGGSRDSAARETCPDGDPAHPACLHNRLADREGFAVVYPDGHPGAVVEKLRSWNAGGGKGKWRATGKGAVDAKSDDTAFVRALLDDLEGRMAVDRRRIYAAGLSNGGAMSWRVACTLSDRIAAVAPIGGGLQWTTTHRCTPEREVPVLYIHGTEDPCWRYPGGESECPVGQRGKEHVSAASTVEQWTALHGCRGEPKKEKLPDPKEDGASAIRWTWEGCAFEHVKVRGGGHTWPDGWQYLGAKTVGPVWRDHGDELLWAFFERHVLPE